MPEPDLRKGRRQKSPLDARAISTVDRLPPHSPEAEQGVLGCIFLDTRQSMAFCQEKLPSSAVFYDLRHQAIYDCLCEMDKAGEGIDVITVQARLKEAHQLEAVGGISYLAGLPDTVPSAANLSFYVNIVLEKWHLRTMVQTCSEIVNNVFQHEGEVDDLLADSLRALNDLSNPGSEKLTVKEAVTKNLAFIEQRFTDNRDGRSTLVGLSTGLIDLNKITGGLRKQDMIVIGARPSCGKSSIGMNIADHLSVDLGVPVGVISMEMSTESLVMRMLCTRARLNSRNVNEGYLSERDFPKLTTAASAIAKSPLYIYDAGGLTVAQLRGKARRMVQQYAIQFLLIDYLQLLHGGGRFENRNSEITFISGSIKALAKELDIPIMVLAQLNRELEKDKNRKPRMSDLRDGGAIEQDADIIGLLYRPSRDEEEAQECEVEPINLLLAKNRNGQSNTDIKFTFLKTITKFESMAKIAAGDER